MQKIKNTGIRITPAELKRRNIEFTSVRFENKIILIKEFDKDEGIYLAETTTDIPLWKQAMDMQMGRVPRQIKTDVMQYRVWEAPVYDGQCYELWEVA